VSAGGVGTPELDVTQSGGGPCAFVASQSGGNPGGVTASKSWGALYVNQHRGHGSGVGVGPSAATRLTRPAQTPGDLDST